MKIWITKDALTKGIEEVEVSHPVNSANNEGFGTRYVTVCGRLYWRRDWFKTRAVAVMKAKIMQQQRLTKLEEHRKLLAVVFD